MKTHILCYSRESKFDKYASLDMSIENQVRDHFRFLARDYSWNLKYEDYKGIINESTKWCGQFEHGGYMIDFGSEKDESGKDLDRRQMQRHMELIKQGIVLEWRGRNDTRFIRNLYEAGDLLKLIKSNEVKWTWYQNPDILKDKKAFEITTMTSGFAVSDGRKHFGFLAERKLLEGLPCRNPPIGYLMKDKNFIIDKKNASAVRKVFEMALNGDSVAKIASSVKFDKSQSPIAKRNDTSVLSPFMSLSQIRSILRNKVYAGYLQVRIWDEWRMVYEDKEYKGTYEPIVSLSDFEAVQKKK